MQLKPCCCEACAAGARALGHHGISGSCMHWLQNSLTLSGDDHCGCRKQKNSECKRSKFLALFWSWQGL